MEKTLLAQYLTVGSILHEYPVPNEKRDKLIAID
jgi:hypothetical protein